MLHCPDPRRFCGNVWSAAKDSEDDTDHRVAFIRMSASLDEGR